MIKIKLAILTLCFSLSGCSTYKGSFDCEASKGESCKSISRINSLVNVGKLSEEENNIRVWHAPEGGNLEGNFEFIEHEEME